MMGCTTCAAAALSLLPAQQQLGKSAAVSPTPLCTNTAVLFGSVCLQGLRDDALQSRVEAAVRDTLSAFAPSV